MVNATTALSELLASRRQPRSVKATHELRFWLIDQSAVARLSPCQAVTPPSVAVTAAGGVCDGVVSVTPARLTIACCSVVRSCGRASLIDVPPDATWGGVWLGV